VTSTKVDRDCVDTIGVDDNEVLVAGFLGQTGTARWMAELNSKTKLSQACLLEK
jgi:hypothetical protein